MKPEHRIDRIDPVLKQEIPRPAIVDHLRVDWLSLTAEFQPLVDDALVMVNDGEVIVE